MANYKENTNAYNRFGAANPVEAIIFGPNYENITEYITSCVLGPIKVTKQRGWGEIHYRNRKQYIRDKLCMIRDEFLVTPTKEEIIYICEHCFTIDSIDTNCRRIIERAWND